VHEDALDTRHQLAGQPDPGILGADGARRKKLRLALYAAFDPEATRGDAILQDPVSGELVTKVELLEAWRSWGRIIRIMRDIDSGLIQMTISEYGRLPGMFLKIRELYADIRDSYQEGK
jgi:hypothetical protein